MSEREQKSKKNQKVNPRKRKVKKEKINNLNIQKSDDHEIII